MGCFNNKIGNGKEVFVSSINHKDVKNCESIADYARKSIEYLSTKLPGIPYPYPYMTAFNSSGNGGGMEYPMMVNDGIGSSKAEAIGVTAHEIAHTYFPFYMGINERKYAWMDEGWATMMGYEIMDSLMSGSRINIGEGQRLSYYMGQQEELPLAINSNILAGSEGNTYRVAMYERAGFALNLLRKVLGEDLFKKALLEFVNRWNGKHPIPYDFFATFNNVAGENLDWFWIPWYFERGYPDLGIKEAKVIDGTHKTIIQKEGIMPVPIFVKFIFEDGTSEDVTCPITVWKKGNREYTVEFKSNKIIDRIQLGSPEIPDVNKSNNKFMFNEDLLAKPDIKEYAGTYGKAVITAEGNLIYLAIAGQKFEMTHVKKDEFEIGEGEIKFRFIRNEENKIASMEVTERGKISNVKKK